MYGIRACSNAGLKKVMNCANQMGHFNFNLQCTYKTANSFYVVSCKPNHGFLTIIRYRCSISHYINVQGVCCNAVCWFNRTNVLYSYFRKKMHSLTFFLYSRWTMIFCPPFEIRKRFLQFINCNFCIYCSFVALEVRLNFKLLEVWCVGRYFIR